MFMVMNWWPGQVTVPWHHRPPSEVDHARAICSSPYINMQNTLGRKYGPSICVAASRCLIGRAGRSARGHWLSRFGQAWHPAQSRNLSRSWSRKKTVNTASYVHYTPRANCITSSLLYMPIHIWYLLQPLWHGGLFPCVALCTAWFAFY